MSVSKQLTHDQRMLVKSMEFHHLLDLCCESVPRGISIWLANRFDIKSRALILPNGSSVPITPLSIHRVLGIPNGGRAIAKEYDESVKIWVCQETKCKGTTPTINELKALLTPDLTGDKFKMVFTLFAVSSLLCPSSYGCASTDYYSAIASPDKISEYDWCGAVLDKITQSIEFYQKTQASSSTATLGGCILVLVILYFELLDIQVSRDSQQSPCLKAFEALDATDDKHSNFGRLRLKEPPSKTNNLVGSHASKATQTCAEPLLESSHAAQVFKAEIASTFQDFQRDIINAIEPIMSSYSNKLYNLGHSLQQQSSDQNEQGNPGFGGLNSLAELKLGNSEVPGTTCTHNNSPNPAKNQVCTATQLPDSTHANLQQRNTLHTELSKPEVPTNEMPFSIDAPIRTNQELSSFVQVPSFSQDSSSNTVSYAAGPEHPLPPETNSSDRNSGVQRTQIQLEPKLIQCGVASTSVFLSRQPSAANTSQIKHTEASVHSTTSTKLMDSHLSVGMNVETPTTTNEFNFWGEANDSDFEVKLQQKQL
ncbi:unnamed protein product [Urochloa humidicola]